MGRRWCNIYWVTGFAWYRDERTLLLLDKDGKVWVTIDKFKFRVVNVTDPPKLCVLGLGCIEAEFCN